MTRPPKKVLKLPTVGSKLADIAELLVRHGATRKELSAHRIGPRKLDWYFHHCCGFGLYTDQETGKIRAYHPNIRPEL